MTDYNAEAIDDAKRMVEEFRDQLIEKLIESGEASDDFNNDYAGGDRWHHETHINRDYSLQEAAELLSNLYRHKETDSGLWEGLDPERAIAAQAAFTYGNTVASEWSDLIEEINDKWGEVSPALDLLESAYAALEEAGVSLKGFPELDTIKKETSAAMIDQVIA